MRLLYTLVIVCFFNSVNAKTWWKHFILHPDSIIQGYDTNYVQPLLNQVTARYFLNVKQARVIISPLGDDKEYSLEAGDFLRYGVGVGYRWLILNYSYGYDPQKTGPNGTSNIRYDDIQMNIFGKKWLYDVRAQFYRGFTLDNIFRPDIKVIGLGTSLRYNFNNHRYSFKNTYDQTQWQTKSAGSPIAGINFAYTRITADSPVKVGNNSDFRFGLHENYNMYLGAGYSYTFVYKKHWFATYTLTMYVDASIVGSKQNFTSVNELHFRVIPESRFGFGYNSTKYYVGFSSTIHKLPGRLSDNLDYTYQYSNLKLLFVHRFNFNPYKKNE